MHLKIIAEIGGNHCGNLEEAELLVVEAVVAGATHVKFQCFEAEQMVGDPDYVLHDGPWAGRTLLDLYRQTHTPKQWFGPLFEVARKYGATPFASVFHKDDVDFLEKLDCPIYKISSFEANDFELVQYAKDTGKELIISTGVSTEDELFDLYKIAGEHTTYMRCVSGYPAKESQMGLGQESLFWGITRPRLKWGLSDHTTGVGAACAAVALGAEAIEKHFTISHYGPDAGFSVGPMEFAHFVNACKQAYRAVQPAEQAEIPGREYRRTLWWARDLHPGDVVTREDIKIARPGDGLDPCEIGNVLGKMVVTPVHKHSPVSAQSRWYE